ncbi:VPLPA-CTERM sorting domain-containing protein, partial [Haematobacter missouriensis]
VPLPAAAPLILAGTAALWAVGRRRVGESCGSRA